jgi:hypothetical protein
MLKKKKTNWKKIGKKAKKGWVRTQDWIGKNINPDVLSGTYGTGGFGGLESPRNEPEFEIRGIDWETELYGSQGKKKRRR